MKYSELQDKQVVDVKDGTIIGRVDDLDVNLSDFKVQAFLVNRSSSFFRSLISFFVPAAKITVNLDQIVSIGEDVILIHPRASK